MPGIGLVCVYAVDLYMLTRHVDCVREEVARVRDQEDDTALDLWIPSDVRELQQKARPQPDEKADDQAAEEDHQKYSNRLKEGQRGEFADVGIVVFPRRFEKHNRNRVVQYRLSKDDSI